MILEPVAAVLLHHLMRWLLTLRDQRIANRLKNLEQRRRKIVTELKARSRSHLCLADQLVAAQAPADNRSKFC